MGIAQPELCSGNLIPASPLCLESSRISCMCILLLTTTRARARMWRRSPWHHGLHIIYTVAPCCSSPSSPTAHFTYPCKVHFPLLLGSPCGVLPPAGGMEEEERGCKGRVMGGEGKRMVVEWGDRLRARSELSYVGIHRDIAGYSFLGENGFLGHIGHRE